jgi:hypothetical protein
VLDIEELKSVPFVPRSHPVYRATYRKPSARISRPNLARQQRVAGSMREMADKRSREISTAYALIKEARGFT